MSAIVTVMGFFLFVSFALNFFLLEQVRFIYAALSSQSESTIKLGGCCIQITERMQAIEATLALNSHHQSEVDECMLN